MEKQQATACSLFAAALCYPGPGHLARLEQGLEGLKAGGEKSLLVAFLGRVRKLSLGQWEELHTRTLDLNPPAAPYVGFQTWGESYQRGEFLARMNREMYLADIDPEGELPDHLVPVLRYLACAAEPVAQLLEVFGPAVQRMHAALKQADADNPYLFLLEGALSLAKNARPEAV